MSIPATPTPLPVTPGTMVPDYGSMPTPSLPDTVALPAALQAQLAQQQPAAQGQPPVQPGQPPVQPGQPPVQPGQPQAPVDPMNDAELAQFFVNASQQPDYQPQQPGYQQPGYQPQQPGYQQPGYQQPGYQQPQTHGFTPDDRLTRIEQAQSMLLDAMRQYAPQQQTQQPGQPPAGPQGQPAALPASELAVAIEAAELTPEERQFFQGKEAQFQKLFAGYAKAQIEPILQRIASVAQTHTQRLAEIDRNNAVTSQRTVRQLISARIPDFETLLQQPQFAAYLKQIIPEVGLTRAEIMRAAVDRGDISLLQTHVEGYKRASGTVPAPAQATQAMQQPLAQPRSPAPVQATQTRVVTPETLMAAEEAMRKGQLSPDKMTKLVEIFRSQQAQQAQQMQMRPAQAQPGIRYA